MAEKENEIEELERMFTNESSELLRIPYSVIKSITKNFCQVIGRGGFGTVYLGAVRNDVMVAVKKVHISNDLSDEQFLGEMKCLRTVNHNNIVRFLGYCAYAEGVVMEMAGNNLLADAPERFLCFEYAPNGTLQDYIQEKTHGYNWNICYKIIKGICEGLHCLHQKKIVHLDLKPANILLGAQMEPKITDFGVSRFTDRTHQFTENPMGTLGYMPPELIDKGEISFKTDIFSLGRIMERLLTESNENNPENWYESLSVDCPQKKRCIEIARICADKDPKNRPTISDVICKLTETETTNQNVSPVTEPGNDPTSKLYQNVKTFLEREYYSGAEKLPVEHPKWKLAFLVQPKFPIIIGETIRDANGNPLEVILVDADTGEPSSDVPDTLQIQLVPLPGNFAQDFDKGVLLSDQPLINGDVCPTMWEGRAILSSLRFTARALDCRSMLRVGVRVEPGSFRGARILEGTTEAFIVRYRSSYEEQRRKNCKWQLQFQTFPRFPAYVGEQIRDCFGNPLEVILVDTETGLPSGLLPVMELLLQLDVVVASDDQLQLVSFGSLSGDVRLAMKDDGRVTVNELQYTCTSLPEGDHYIRVRVVPGSYNGPGTILEGLTPILIKDRQEEDKTTTGPPLRHSDPVWRLRGVSRGGVIHRRLNQNNIFTVQDLLSILAMKSAELRAILGGDGKVDDSTWSDEIIRHARTCAIPRHLVFAYTMAHATIYANPVCDLVKLELGGEQCQLQQQDEAQKILVQKAMQEAYEQRHKLEALKLTWKLAFKRQPRLPLNAGSLITDTAGKPLEVILVDAETGSQWALPMELHIVLVPLLGEFRGQNVWSQQEFQEAVVKGRKLNKPLLRLGNDHPSQAPPIMRDGSVAVPKGLHFTEDSSWVDCRKFRIGAYVLPKAGDYDGSFRIVEGVTEAFQVGDLNPKHYPPVLGDPVWRLEMIDKDGVCHKKKLTSNNVDTVQEFLRMENVKPLELRAIVGDAMTDRMWQVTVRHATDCDPGDKVYAYSGANGTIYVDSVFHKLFMLQIDGECLESLDDEDWDIIQLMIAKQLILDAYEHRHNLQQVDTAMELLVDKHNVGYVPRVLALLQCETMHKQLNKLAKKPAPNTP